jgi:hypothetical protein
MQLWDATTGQVALAPEADWALYAFSPDALTLATVAEGGVKLRDVPTGRERRILSGPTSRTRALAYSPDGKLVAMGSEWSRRPGEFWPQEVHLWRAETGQLVSRLTVDSEGFQGFHTLEFSPDSRFLVGYGGLAAPTIWDVSSSPPVDLERLLARRILSHVSPGPQPAFSPDGRWLILQGEEVGTLKVLDTTTLAVHTLLHAHRGEDYADHLVFSPDGEKLALYVYYEADSSPGITTWIRDHLLGRSPKGEARVVVKVFYIPTGEELATFPGSAHGGAFYMPVAFAPDGRTLVAPTADSGAEDSALMALWEIPQPRPRGWPYGVGCLGAFALAWALHRHWRRRRGIP